MSRPSSSGSMCRVWVSCESSANYSTSLRVNVRSNVYLSPCIGSSIRVIADRCGSWSLAIRKSGLKKESQREYTEEDCLRSIQALADDIQDEPMTFDYKNSGYKPSLSVIKRVCGSWTDTKERAGVIGKYEYDTKEEFEEQVSKRLDYLTGQEKHKSDE